jgi:UDP-2,3-diacylglucosamine pyrophosphatase LpxH
VAAEERVHSQPRRVAAAAKIIPVLTVVISDLHLGARPVNDVLRSHEVRARLMPWLARADQVVLLGDVVELRQGPLDEAMDAARPFFGELGESLGDGRVVIVPGNHDHQLLGERPAAQLERTATARDSGPLGRIASWLPQIELVLSYPGYRIRPDVWATHGHYLDCHNTVPTIETIFVALLKRRSGFPEQGPLGVVDYERAQAPLYDFAFRAAQRMSGERAPVATSTSHRVWKLLARDDGSPSVAAKLLGGVVLPGGVAALNRLGFGRFSPELSGPVLRESGLRAIGDVVERLGIEAEHVIFGHTHRLGPLERDAGWTAPGGASLHNCGSWVYEPAFLGHSSADSPYWPGGVLLVDDDGPPRVERPLTDLQHDDFASILEPSSRALWPDPRDAESSPPQ